AEQARAMAEQRARQHASPCKSSIAANASTWTREPRRMSVIDPTDLSFLQPTLRTRIMKKQTTKHSKTPRPHHQLDDRQLCWIRGGTIVITDTGGDGPGPK